MIKKKTVTRFLLIPVLLYVLFYFISSIWIKSTCQNQLTGLKPTQYGTSFEVTPHQIKSRGWRWMDPIPDGLIRQIDTYGTSRYVDKETARPVDVNAVYIIKDSRGQS